MLSEDTVALLHEIRGKQITQQLEVADAWTDSGYVFTDEAGMPVDPNLATRTFKKVLASAGLPKLTIHGLRHTHATILLEQGVNPKVVSERLGHASVATTINDGYLFPCGARFAGKRGPGDRRGTSTKINCLKEVILVVSIQAIKRRTTYGR